MPRAIILDLDDTILAYDAAAEGCWSAVCAEFAPAAGVTADALLAGVTAESAWYWSDPERHRVGRQDLTAARREIILRVLGRLGGNPAPAAAMAEMRQALHDAALFPFPGALETVRAWHAAGVPLALITNGAAVPQHAKIDRFGLRPYFHSIVVEGEFGTGKPDPRVFRHTLDVLGVAPADAWMIGDHLHLDIAPAQALGLTGIWNDHAGTGLPADAPVVPDRIIRNLAELQVC
jgi:putative hydrolase of the HAD superfamily